MAWKTVGWWVATLAACAMKDEEEEPEPELLDTSIVSDCACFEQENSDVSLLCDPGEDCGVVELACPDGDCHRSEALVSNPEVLDCAFALLDEGRPGTFGYGLGLTLGSESGSFYTDGATAFVLESSSYDISFELQAVATGPLRDAEALAACRNGTPEQRFDCLWHAMDHVEDTCTKRCSNGICED